MAGTCVYCRCTEDAACAGGCRWANAAQTICSVCADAADTARELVRVLGLTAGPRGFTIATPSFDALPVEDQAAIVRTCRSLVETIRAGVRQAVTDEVAEALRLRDVLTAFLIQHCADEIRDDDTTADVVLRLLKPHVGTPFEVRL